MTRQFPPDAGYEEMVEAVARAILAADEDMDGFLFASQFPEDYCTQIAVAILPLITAREQAARVKALREVEEWLERRIGDMEFSAIHTAMGREFWTVFEGGIIPIFEDLQALIASAGGGDG